MSNRETYVGATARERYLEKLIAGEPFGRLTVLMQSNLYEHAVSLGLCDECKAKADAKDPLRTIPAREGEEEAILARLEAIPAEMQQPGADRRALVQEARVLHIRLSAIEDQADRAQTEP